MDGKMLARLGAVVFVAIALTVTAIDMARKDSPSALPPALQPPADPLRENLRRCQQLGEATASDAGCHAAWAESRNRFLGRTPAPATPHSSEGR